MKFIYLTSSGPNGRDSYWLASAGSCCRRHLAPLAFQASKAYSGPSTPVAAGGAKNCTPGTILSAPKRWDLLLNLLNFINHRRTEA